MLRVLNIKSCNTAGVESYLSFYVYSVPDPMKQPVLNELDIQDIDNCESTPCGNGGICSDGLDDFFCDCLAGFTGKSCAESKWRCYATSRAGDLLTRVYRFKLELQIPGRERERERERE